MHVFATESCRNLQTDMPPVVVLLQADVLLKRKQTQQYLLHHLWHIPPEVGPPAASFRLLRASSAVPDASLLDLLCCAWQPELMLEFNPFLSTAALSRLHEGVLTWLQLCVLEDKLARLVQYAEAGAEAEAMLKQVSMREAEACLQSTV